MTLAPAAPAFVMTLPAPPITARILELAKDDLTPGRICRRMFGRRGREALVRTVLSDPEMYDPILDEVAVARALAGERSVFEALTHYERREVFLAVHVRREAETSENRHDRDSFHGAQWDPKKGWPYVQPHAVVPDWLQQLSDGWGIEPNRLLRTARGYAKARVL